MLRNLINKLQLNRTLTDAEFIALIDGLKTADQEIEQYLFGTAEAVRQSIYGNDVYIRGLIEISNYCKNDCFYCGIRRSNSKADRYRLTKEEILQCCANGHALGFRTFVLQGGEDPYYTDERICDIVRTIKVKYPDCAVTLSIGEKSRGSYQAYYDAGADRYLLRHETADCEHYSMLHPAELTGEHRQQCLFDLKEIGYQVGCGIMVGTPWQTTEHIVKDLRFIEKLQPHMIGIGPFIPHQETPFADKEGGSIEDTLHLLSIIRLMLPEVLLPATTALGTVAGNGRERGIMAGANVVMPNLSPSDVRDKYLLYDGKINTGAEGAESIDKLESRMQAIGYNVIESRGDHLSRQEDK